jgi:hypothetical protein
MTDQSHRQIPPDAIEALKRGNKIEAIKLTRIATGMTLKDSKEAVESLILDDTDVRSAYQSKVTTLTSTGLVKLVVNLLLIGAVIYFVLTRG